MEKMSLIQQSILYTSVKTSFCNNITSDFASDLWNQNTYMQKMHIQFFKKS